MSPQERIDTLVCVKLKGWKRKLASFFFKYLKISCILVIDKGGGVIYWGEKKETHLVADSLL